MSAIETSTTPSVFASHAPEQRLVKLARTLLRRIRNRRDMRRLQALSDWQLADIGLSRDDLDIAWAGSADIDPTARLDGLVRHRNRIEAAARRVA